MGMYRSRIELAFSMRDGNHCRERHTNASFVEYQDVYLTMQRLCTVMELSVTAADEEVLMSGAGHFLPMLSRLLPENHMNLDPETIFASQLGLELKGILENNFQPLAGY